MSALGFRTFRTATLEETLRFSRGELLRAGLMPALVDDELRAERLRRFRRRNGGLMPIAGGARGFYDVGVRSASLTAAGNYADIRAGASIPLRIVEVGVSMGVAGASPTLALQRETAAGTASTTAVPQAEETADGASSGTVGTAWSVAPTLGAVPLRRITLPASLGAGWVWAWPESNPLIMPVSLGLMVALSAISAATATAIDVYFRHLE